MKSHPPTPLTSLSIVKMRGWEENEKPVRKPDRAPPGTSPHNGDVTSAKKILGQRE